jgi:DeoR family fructose operon transcriptional repressor
MKKEQIFVEERKAAIVEYVNAKKKAGVAELCEKFGVSSATIRNDLRDLEQNRLLVRTHGGVMVKGQARFEPAAADKSVQHAEEKRAIARAALQRVEDGDTLILDTGSTTIELARILNERSNITVLTNDLVIASILEGHQSATIHMIGGVLRRGFHCTVGSAAVVELKNLTVDKAFMAANAFTFEKGACTPDMSQAELKRLMVSIATKVFLLIDSSKFGRNSFACFCSSDSLDCLITDALLKEDRERLEESGIEVIEAKLE